jgi:hypothetical protein
MGKKKKKRTPPASVRPNEAGEDGLEQIGTRSSSKRPFQHLQTPLSSTLGVAPTLERSRWSLWRVIKAIGTIIGGVIAILALLEAVPALRYDVDVNTYATVNSKNPFKTAFVLTNQSPFAIDLIGFSCAYAHLVTENGPQQHAVYPFFALTTLPAHGSITLYCLQPTSIHGNHLGVGALLDINAYYQADIVYRWHKRNTWPNWERGGKKFILQRNEEDDTVFWTPIGPSAKNMEELEGAPAK